MRITEEKYDSEGSYLEIDDIFPKSQVSPGLECGINVSIGKDPQTCNIVTTYDGVDEVGIMMDGKSAIKLANFILKSFGETTNLKIVK